MRSGLLITLAGLFSILLIDIITYLFFKKSIKRYKFIRFCFWGITALTFTAIIALNIIMPKLEGPEVYPPIEAVIGIISIFYAPKIFLVIFKIISSIINIFTKTGAIIINYISFSLTILLLFAMIYGFTLGRYDYVINNTEIKLANLPNSFKNFKIVQLSDLHLGSVGANYPGIAKLVEMTNAQNPDLILFTGDMINNFASEMDNWIDVLSKLKAKYGKYAITGNHDYGDYSRWESLVDKRKNMRQYYKNMKDAGFIMLNNTNTILTIGRDSIYLAGVENWGKPPFPQYGKLNKAIEGCDKFTILMSHDPSQWKAQIIGKNLPLTLSGHTHAMQMGIKILGWEWSPAKYIYPEYDGLYKENNQYLYVSRGQGYIGLPGRIGLRPELTVLILK